MFKIEGFEHLSIPIKEYNLVDKIINQETNSVFNTNEFEYKTRQIDWVTSNLVNESINLITDLVKITDIKVDFGQAKKNNYFELLLENGFDLVLEGLVRDTKVFGNGYIELAVEDNLDTASEEVELRAYNINPLSIYADYDIDNPQRGAKRYIKAIKKVVDDNDFVLFIIYQPGVISYEAYKDYQNKGVKVDAMTLFREFFSESLSYSEEDLTYSLVTNLEYSVLTHVNNGANFREFYGKSDINNAVVSNLQLLERMYNLADYANTNNAKPERIYSKSSESVLIRAIKEVTEGNNLMTLDNLNPLANPNGTSKIGVSRIKSLVNQHTKNALAYSVDSGDQGTDRYLTNPYKLDDLYLLIDKAKQNIYSAMNISELFYNPELSTGNVSGVAMKRLMSRTIEHVKNLRNKLEGKIKQFAFTSLQFAKQSQLPDATYPDVTDLPDIYWPEIVEDSVENIINKYSKALEIKPAQELKDEAVASILDKELKTIEKMEIPKTQTIAETINQRLNGGGNTNQ